MDLQHEELWYAFVTRPRHEKKVKAFLEGSGITHYLPLRRTLNQWKDRRRWVEAPLFPGYIFCRIPFVNRFQVLQTPGIVRIVSFENKPMPVRECEIETIRNLLKTGVSVEVRPGLIPGDLVRITSGILMGFEGRIVEERGSHYFVIHVESIGKSIVVDIRSAELKKIA